MKRKIVSYIASAALSIGLSLSSANAQTPFQTANYQTYVKKRDIIDKTKDIKLLEMLSDIVYTINQKTCEHILLQNKCDIEVAEKQQIKKVIKLLTLVINVSSRPKFQDDSTIEYDKKVYYSSLALKNLLECFINEEYMNNIGFEALKDNFNCLAYGKEVENVDRAFNV